MNEFAFHFSVSRPPSALGAVKSFAVRATLAIS
jgi:hypothetical protein